MAQIEKTVFISYRRTNKYVARAVYENLTRHGYDVFLDYQSIDSGSFAQIILQSIESRAHFIMILTPSALEKCQSPKDWLRREIEHALKHKRNIIPLTFEGFDFEEMHEHLPQKIAQPLSEYNGLNVYFDYFDEAMDKLRSRYLNIALDAVLHPFTKPVEKYEAEQKQKISTIPEPTSDELEAVKFFEQAFQFSERDNLNRAIKAYAKAIRLNPAYPEAHLNRGNAYYNQKKYEKAIAAYSEAIRLDPDYAPAYSNRGNTYNDQGEYELALKDYNEAIRLDPDYAPAYNNRGAAYNEQGKYELALKDLNEAIRLNPDYAPAYHNRGKNYSDQGEYELALKDYNEAIRLNPDYAEAYTGRGTTYGKQRRHGLALKEHNKAIRLNPDYAEAYTNRGVSHYFRGNITQALDDFTKALQLNPDEYIAQNNRGVVYFTLERFVDALADYKKVLDVEPDFNLSLGGIAVTYHRLADVKQAKFYWAKLIDLDEQYQDPDWAADTLNWPEIMREEARQLVAKMSF